MLLGLVGERKGRDERGGDGEVDERIIGGE
jgi:hypothetical protein